MNTQLNLMGDLFKTENDHDNLVKHIRPIIRHLKFLIPRTAGESKNTLTDILSYTLFLDGTADDRILPNTITPKQIKSGSPELLELKRSIKKLAVDCYMTDVENRAFSRILTLIEKL